MLSQLSIAFLTYERAHNNRSNGKQSEANKPNLHQREV